MNAFISKVNKNDPTFQRQRKQMLALVQQLRDLEDKAAEASQKSFKARAKDSLLSPRERVGQLIDKDKPFLPLATLAGYGLDDADLNKCLAGGAQIAGIGFVNGVRCMIVANDSGIDAGALTEGGVLKLLRCQELALQNRLPFIHLVESAGANLRKYRVGKFVRGGRLFYNLARLSAAGLPVITVVHGSSTAGGAYMPGLSDYVVMVRDRAKAFLAGPPLLKAATGEIATAEELGGAQMHANISGLAEYVAEDDVHALEIARQIVSCLNWKQTAPAPEVLAPRWSQDEIAGIMTLSHRQPIEMREIIVRLTDDSYWLDFKPEYGPATICGHGEIDGCTVGFITNNGPLDPAGATKAAQFIQLCNQTEIPIIFLQNTTGFIVGKESEQSGMIKHGSKMIQALSNSKVPHITLMCGASFGAGNYGMCGYAFEPRFCFSWPNARTAVMGGEQAANTLETVVRDKMKRVGQSVNEEKLASQKQAIINNLESQADAFFTSGQVLDDGVIDPRHTRDVLRFVLATMREAEKQPVQPIQFGVARF